MYILTSECGTVSFKVSQGRLLEVAVTDKTKEIVVPNVIKEIAPKVLKKALAGDKDSDRCFSVIFGGGIEHIGDSFRGIEKLSAVRLGAGVRRIDAGAFSDCTELTRVDGTEGVRSVGSGAFSGCEKLEYLYLPSLSLGVAMPELPEEKCKFKQRRAKKIYEREKAQAVARAKDSFVFDGGLSRSARIEVGENNPDFSTRDGSLYDKELRILYFASVREKSFCVPDGVEKISDGAFSGATDLVNVSLPRSLKEIGREAFKGCKKLTTVSVRGDDARDGAMLRGVKIIGDGAFSGCRLIKSVDVSDATYIGEYAFSGCLGLISARIPEATSAISKGAFYKCARLKELNLSPSLSSVGAYAFCGCYSLELPSAMRNLSEIGSYGFSHCARIEALTLRAKTLKLGDYAFFHCIGLKSVEIFAADKLSEHAFEGCAGLESLKIGCFTEDGKEKRRGIISRFALRGCTRLTELALPEEGVSFIGRYALSLTAIEKFHIGKELVEVEDGAFSGCRKLRLSVSKENPSFSSVDGDLRSKAGDVLYFPGACSETFRVPESVGELAPKAISDMGGIKRVEIGSWVHHIGECAFASMPDLEEAVFEDAELDIISAGAFACCYRLKSIKLPKDLRRIESDAFLRCFSLDRVESEGEDFACAEFEEDFSDSCPSLDAQGAAMRRESVEKGEHSRAEIGEAELLPRSLLHLGSGAFAFARSLGAVAIPDSVISMGDFVFGGCRGLRAYVGAGNKDFVSKDGSLYRRVKLSGDGRVGFSLSAIYLSVKNGERTVTMAHGVCSASRGAFCHLGEEIDVIDLSLTPMVKPLRKRDFLGTGIKTEKDKNTKEVIKRGLVVKTARGSYSPKE